MIQGRYIKEGNCTELISNGTDEIKSDKVVSIQAWTMMPKGKRKKRPEWVDVVIITSVIAPQIYSLMFFSTLVTQHEIAWLVLAAAAQSWTWLVLFANYRKPTKERRKG